MIEKSARLGHVFSPLVCSTFSYSLSRTGPFAPSVRCSFVALSISLTERGSASQVSDARTSVERAARLRDLGFRRVLESRCRAAASAPHCSPRRCQPWLASYSFKKFNSRRPPMPIAFFGFAKFCPWPTPTLSSRGFFLPPTPRPNWRVRSSSGRAGKSACQRKGFAPRTDRVRLGRERRAPPRKRPPRDDNGSTGRLSAFLLSRVP
jgi:hypothetical protein